MNRKNPGKLGFFFIVFKEEVKCYLLSVKKSQREICLMKIL